MRKYNIQVRTSKGELVDSYVFSNLDAALLKLKELHEKAKVYHIIQLNCILIN